jgi:hypothetical protein
MLNLLLLKNIPTSPAAQNYTPSTPSQANSSLPARDEVPPSLERERVAAMVPRDHVEGASAARRPSDLARDECRFCYRIGDVRRYWHGNSDG